jgi:hypothetical protein
MGNVARLAGMTSMFTLSLVARTTIWIGLLALLAKLAGA